MTLLIPSEEGIFQLKTELETARTEKIEIESRTTTEGQDNDFADTKDTSAKNGAEGDSKGVFALKKELEDENSTLKTDDKTKLTQVTINIVGARKLAKTSKFGKADPYVLLSCNGQKFKSVKVSNSSNPEWNFVNTIYINKEVTTEFSVEVYDEDTFTKDDFMGRVVLKIEDLSRLQRAEWMPLRDCKAGEILISAELVDDVEGSNDQPLCPTSDKSNDEAEIKTIIILEKKGGKSLAEEPQDAKDENVSAPTEEITDIETVSTKSEPEAEKETRKEGSRFAGEPDIQATEKTVAAASIGGDQVVEEVKISFDDAEDDDKSMVSAEAKDGTTTEIKYEEDSARWDLSPERIELIVHAARDLPKKGMFGKADPYVVISP